MKPVIKLSIICFLSVALFTAAGSKEENPALPDPLYVCSLPNINDYDIFANSGWDGNWYIGSNLCWIKELPPAPAGIDFTKAFIGAKIGRAKTQPVAGKASWEKESIDGQVYIALASTPAWAPEQRYFLASTKDIPIEGDNENALEGSGEARWFWAEVPLDAVNLNGPNFIALWSPNDYLVLRDSSPILCAGWGIKQSEQKTWLNDEIRGEPPTDPSASLKTAVSVFEPAIAMKLVPEKTQQAIKVIVTDIIDGRPGTNTKVISASIGGSSIERSWVETAPEDLSAWTKTSRYLYNPPYIFTVDSLKFPEGKIYIRVICEDIWGNRGFSRPIEMFVQRQKQ